MKQPPRSLKSGLALMGQSSIFSEETVSNSEAVAAAKSLTIANLHLPNQAEYKVLINPNSLQQQQMLLAFEQGKYYQPEVTQLLMQVLQPGDCFVDLQAEIGYFVALAAMIVGDRGKVIACESDSNHAAQLAETVRLNAFRQVQAVQAEADLALIDRLLAANPQPKLIKLNLDQAVLLLRQGDRSISYLLCAVESAVSNWQNLTKEWAAIGYRGLALTSTGLQPLPQAGALKGSYLLMVHQAV
ncbi:MAG: hypothetical protein F6K28_23555 [Microcoleus sp. SIO2G3]|nr:hypothetical protein [Microcoleus sp. SIO2G3]